MVHRVHHDLESFYWVLVWIICRHTNHTLPEGSDACRTYFPDDGESQAQGMKRQWLMLTRPCAIRGNAPLTALHEGLRRLMVAAHFMGKDLTHEAVLHEFDQALARTDWPEDDKAIPFTAVNTSRMMPVMNSADVGVEGSSLAAMIIGGRKAPESSRKRPAEDEPEERTPSQKRSRRS